VTTIEGIAAADLKSALRQRSCETTCRLRAAFAAHYRDTGRHLDAVSVDEHLWFALTGEMHGRECQIDGVRIFRVDSHIHIESSEITGAGK